MKSADIEIGGEYAYVDHGIVAKVRVTAKGLRTRSYHQSKSGVRVEVIDFATFNDRRYTVPNPAETRRIYPWEEEYEKQMADWRTENELTQRIARIADRLGNTARLTPGTARVTMHHKEFLTMAERIGVELD